MDQGKRRFPDAGQDARVARATPQTPQTRAPAYRLAFADEAFLCRDELRPVRLQLELLKPELGIQEAQIASTVVLFGSARIPAPEARPAQTPEAQKTLWRYYDEAREFARLITLKSVQNGGRHNVIVTGGGPGIMEAGNRGAAEAGGVSIGLNIVLPHEQAPNPYITPDLCFNFHYFGIRKMHFLMRAAAIVIFPGGFGTLDEMFEALTLIQSHRMKAVPFVLFGRDYWEQVIGWQALVDAGTVSPEDLALFHYAETADEAVALVEAWQAQGA